MVLREKNFPSACAPACLVDICSYLVDDFHSDSGQAGVETSGHRGEINEAKNYMCKQL